MPDENAVTPAAADTSAAPASAVPTEEKQITGETPVPHEGIISGTPAPQAEDKTLAVETPEPPAEPTLEERFPVTLATEDLGQLKKKFTLTIPPERVGTPGPFVHAVVQGLTLAEHDDLYRQHWLKTGKLLA